MSDTATFEISVLENKISELFGALSGREGSWGQCLRVEAAQAAWRISESLGPNSYPSTVEKLEKNAATVLRTEPSKNNLEQESESYADFTWLYASPFALTGINDEDDQRKASVSEALVMLRAGQKHPRGTPWTEVGRRGKQHIMRLNRTLVSKSTFRGVVKAIADRIGQSRAAFARVTLEIFPSKRVPAFVRNQVPRVIENGKSIYRDATDQALPFVELGSRCVGVESNPVVRQKIIGGIQSAKVTLEAKIRKVIAGQSYNWNTGQVFRPTNFEDN